MFDLIHHNDRDVRGPEILPPASQPVQPGTMSDAAPDYDLRTGRYTGEQPRSQIGSRILSGWAYAPATYILISINVLVFLMMSLKGVSWWDPSGQQLLDWGANNGHLELQGQWWQWGRLLTATFVHIGIIHIATNMWCLWNLGLLGEPLLGAYGVIAVYVLTGVAGNLLSTAVSDPYVIGAGASGAVFGIAGILILLLNSPHLPFPRPELLRLRRSVIYFAVINLAIGASTHIFSVGIKIDNMAHLGGFLSGMAMGVPLAPVLGTGKGPYFKRQKIVFSIVTLFLLLFANWIIHFRKA